MRLATCLVQFIVWSGLLAVARTADSTDNENALLHTSGRKLLAEIPVSQLSADVDMWHRQLLNSVHPGTVPPPCTRGFTGCMLNVRACHVVLRLSPGF